MRVILWGIQRKLPRILEIPRKSSECHGSPVVQADLNAPCDGVPYSRTTNGALKREFGCVIRGSQVMTDCEVNLPGSASPVDH